MRDGRPLRVALFGTGSPLSLAAADAAAKAAELILIVAPKGASPMLAAAARLRVPLVRDDEELASHLRQADLDLVLIAAFGRRLASDALQTPRLGTLNLHPSLLPRHRGADPLFWTYFDDDESAGVTLHWATASVDAGPVIAQKEMALPRAMQVTDLYPKLAALGASLVEEALTRLRTENLAGREQDDAMATTDPRPTRDKWRIDFDSWPVERLWHFLAGLSVRRTDLLAKPHGRALRMQRAEHGRKPGTIERTGSAMRVYARDGWVDLQTPSIGVRLRHLLKR